MRGGPISGGRPVWVAAILSVPGRLHTDAVGLFRPSDGTFYLDANASGHWDGCGTDRCLQIGMLNDVPLVGDWNGSGTSKVGAFRPSAGTFYLDYNGNGVWDGCGVDRCLQIGMNGDVPFVGDWNGSGTSKVGAFRPSEGTFYLDHNGSGTWEGCGVDRCLQIGVNGDVPLVGDWNPTDGATLSGAMLFSSNSSGGIGGGVESNTLGETIGPGVPYGPSNLYLSTTSDASSGFLNSGNGPSTSINIPLVPGTRTFYIFAVGTSDLTGYAGLNLFFNGADFSPASPGITGVNQTNSAGSGVSAASASSTLDLGGAGVTSPRTLVFVDGLTTVTLTSFAWITNASAGDRVSQWNNTPDGWPDYVGSFTLTVSGSASPDKVGVFRPADGTFYLDKNGSGTWDGCGTDSCLQIGQNGDTPLVGDWNGTGTSKVGVFRPADGTFYLDFNGNGAWDGCGTDRCLQIGMFNDTPLVGDWNGSGTSKVGVFRPADGTFYLDHDGSRTWNGCGTDRCLQIGLDGDTPLVGKW